MEATHAPCILMLNGTCLDIIEEHRAWIEAGGVRLWAEQEFRRVTQEELPPLLEQADAVVLPATCSVGDAEMAAARRLRIISIAASGYEWMDLHAATRHGIMVTNAPVRAGAEVVADMAWGLLLAVARQIPFHHQALRERVSSTATGPQAGEEYDPLQRLMRHSSYPRHIGASTWGKTLGIVGLGQIGKAVARRASGFEMRVLAATAYPDADFAARYGVEYVSLECLLRESDFVSLHPRLNQGNEKLIGARELALMKPTAFLINTARPQLVDEAALANAVLEGRIAGAACDDPPSPALRCLLDLPNVIFTTHLGNRAREGMDAVLRCAIENIIQLFRGQQPAHVLNPEVFDSLRKPL